MEPCRDSLLGGDGIRALERKGGAEGQDDVVLDERGELFRYRGGAEHEDLRGWKRRAEFECIFRFGDRKEIHTEVKQALGEGDKPQAVAVSFDHRDEGFAIEADLHLL